MGQVLSPCCALEYIDKETTTMDDSSGFTCIVRSLKIIPIADEISIKDPS